MRIRLAVAFLALMMVFSGVGMAAEEAPAKKYGDKVGDFVKPLQLKALDGGKALDLGTLSKTTVLVMVSSVCSACRTELQEITANKKEFDGKADLYVVVIDVDPEPAIPRIKASGPSLPLLSDPNYLLGNAVNMVSAPSTLILDEEGKILFKGYGYSSGQWKEYARLLHARK